MVDGRPLRLILCACAGRNAVLYRMKPNSFKTRPHTFSIGRAPTNRARCRGCRKVIEKGDTRLVTHAFVRPGRSRDFVRHVGCASPELMKAVIAAHVSVERVPTESGMDADAVSNAHAQLLLLAGVC